MLKVSIRYHWEAEDFIGLFQSIDSLYYKCIINMNDTQTFSRSIFLSYGTSRTSYEDYLDHSNSWLLSQARAITRPSERLRISSIYYGSPGEINFKGSGRALEAIRGLIDDVYKIFVLGRHRREQEEIKTEHMRESLRAMKIETAIRFLEFRRILKKELDHEDIGLVLRDMDELVRLSLEGKINGVDFDRDE